MGPSPLSDGMTIQITSCACVIAASMGPSPLSDGMIALRAARAFAGGASMGPSPLSDGMTVAPMGTGIIRASFNGAVASQRRNVCPYPAINRSRFVRFNGAVASQRRNAHAHGVCGRTPGGLQWGRRLSATEWSRAMLSIGAEAMASMGPSPLSDGMDITVIRSWEHPVASMGPSPLSDGMTTARNGSPTYSICFNGAVASQRRNGRTQRIQRRRAGGFNGAVASQRRNGCDDRRRGRGSARFNGAVASQRRNARCRRT